MISLTNHDSQWGRSEVVIIYPFIDDFPSKTSIYKGFSIAMLHNQMVYQQQDFPIFQTYLFIVIGNNLLIKMIIIGKLFVQ